MQYPTPLLPGRAIRRYKRFFADVQLETGETVTAHCPNTGSMRDSWHPGWRVAISPANNPDRKLKYTLELVHNGRCWISVHTGRTNAVAAEGIAANMQQSARARQMSPCLITAYFSTAGLLQSTAFGLSLQAQCSTLDSCNPTG